MNEFSEPTINKDDSNGVVSISGISMMEDAMDFYKPLKEWADQYLNSNKALVIDFELNFEGSVFTGTAGGYYDIEGKKIE